PVLSRVCSFGTLRDEDADSDHYEELNGDRALAQLHAAKLLEAFENQGASNLHTQLRQALDIGARCGGQDHIALRDEVSKAIIQSDVRTRPGTDVGGLRRTGVAAALGMSVAALMIFVLF